MYYKLGIDVGGTNTDAVLVDDNSKIVLTVKVPTTKDVQTGIENAIKELLNQSSIEKEKIKYSMLGTTQCTNAIVTRKNLNKVVVIRIGAPAGTAVPPIYSMPKDLKDEIGANIYEVKGGHEFNGEMLNQLDKTRIEDIGHTLKGQIDSIAITSIFSPVNADHENEAYTILNNILGKEVSYSLSSEMGSIGLLERENATVLNAAIIDVAKRTTEGFENALINNGVKSRIYFCQNDGTLMSKDYTLKYPILTVACGPTNSLRGASFLSDEENAIIVDIGGTTSDIGILSNGFPRESSLSVELGGVQTNFRMPDIFSLGLGGGTIIEGDINHFKVGPQSVGHKLTEEALIFGGDTLTATDIAVAKGFLELGDAKLIKHLNPNFVDSVYEEMLSMIEIAIERMKTTDNELPVILVGGGSDLIDSNIVGASKVIKPEHNAVSNAIGATISDISGQIEKIYDLEPDKRSSIIESIKKQAIEEAHSAGADINKTKIIKFEDIPLAYLPGNSTRIKVKASGPIDNSEF